MIENTRTKSTRLATKNIKEPVRHKASQAQTYQITLMFWCLLYGIISFIHIKLQNFNPATD